ncbi:Rha family transcriptional regulator [Proteus mirabilis]|uniref:Rha family transcriptional regulator n=1 Tax=Proteus mirabilis TaxID=584 RepID=UPI0023F8679A|nr:Rha family transcriptional regulator [Proteus mirabilis]MDF7387313.1 Rha family transcriptional regulator [Proteus mirabilis]MDF7448724.1 Rha family transcriptional regulator [Proteus mirabilis]
MTNQFPINLNPEIVVNNRGQAVTSSQSVAAFFIKRHDDVLKKIRNLDCSPEFHNRNFAEMSINLKIGNGAMRKTPFFQMTKNGFVFLVMGFTGKKAAQFKEAYISEFDRMEAELTKERYSSIGDSTDKNDLIALVDQLQRTIHEGEFIPANQCKFPLTNKKPSQLIDEFANNPNQCVLHNAISYLKKCGNNVSEAERALNHIRFSLIELHETIREIRIHNQRVEKITRHL